MVVTYEIPEHLVPYVEFIPEEQLCEMLTIALEKAIDKRSDAEEIVPEKETPDYTLLLGKIGEMLADKAIALPAPKVDKDEEEEIFVKPKRKFEVVSAPTATKPEDMDELDELEFDFMNSIMK